MITKCLPEILIYNMFMDLDVFKVKMKPEICVNI